MTEDRDIRFSAAQIDVTLYAIRSEIHKRTRSIEKAESARKAGATIQHNVLESHYAALDAAKAVRANLEAADTALRRKGQHAVGSPAEQSYRAGQRDWRDGFTPIWAETATVTDYAQYVAGFTAAFVYEHPTLLPSTKREARAVLSLANDVRQGIVQADSSLLDLNAAQLVAERPEEVSAN